MASIDVTLLYSRVYGEATTRSTLGTLGMTARLAHKNAATRGLTETFGLAFGAREGDGGPATNGQAYPVFVRLRGRPGDCRLWLCWRHDLVFRPRAAGLSATCALSAANCDPRACRRRPTAGRIRDRAARFCADPGHSQAGDQGLSFRRGQEFLQSSRDRSALDAPCRDH